MIGNPLVLFAAKLRGFLDGVKMARDLLSGKVNSPTYNSNQTGEIPTVPPGQIDIGAVCYCQMHFKKTA